jgi:hypothetical protein
MAFGAGCTYYNAIYNAEHVFEAAERARREGRDSLAHALYLDVVRKAAHGFRQDPAGGWAYEAAYLLGRAHLRVDDVGAARAALDRSAALAETPDERLAAQVYLGVLEMRSARADAALTLFNEALAGATTPAVRGEGHLHRGALLLSRRMDDAGWWDLDRAAAEYPPLRVEATLERLRWGISLRDLGRTEESIHRLLSYPEAAARASDVSASLRDAEEAWGSDAVAGILERAARISWERDLRDLLVLDQAGVLYRADRTEAAERLARGVADGRGAAAARARYQLARWRLGGADDVGDVYAVRPLLLPAVDDPVVGELLSTIDLLEDLTFAGLEVPLAWFVAAEAARDDLGSSIVARDLFLAYANAAPDDPWAPKAVLAALDVADDAAVRAGLRERLERHPQSPYVLAARGRPAAGLEALEEELLARLTEIRLR